MLRTKRLRAENAQLRSESEQLRSACNRTFRALAYGYGGTTPDQYIEPEDRAMCEAMHALYGMGFGSHRTAKPATSDAA